MHSSRSQIFFSNSYPPPPHCYRRYVKQAQSPNSDGRASASASFASSSQAAECSTSSGASGSSLSDGASCCAGSSNGSNHHTGACGGETNGLDDGERGRVVLSADASHHLKKKNLFSGQARRRQWTTR